MTTNNSLSKNPLVLAIDIGTTSLKAAFVSARGEVFSFKRIEYASLLAEEFSRGKGAALGNGFSQGQKAAQDGDCSQDQNAGENRGASQDKNGAAAWAACLARVFPDPLASSCAAVSVSGNGPTIVCENGTTLLWNDGAPQDGDCPQDENCGGENCDAPRHREALQDQNTGGKNCDAPQDENRGGGQDAPRKQNCPQDQDCGRDDPPQTAGSLFEKFDVPEPQKKIYAPRLAAFKKRFPNEWKSAKKLFSAPGWLAFFIEKNAADFGLAPGVPVFEAGPDFIAALVGTATLFPGRLCDRAGSSEGVNLCSPLFFEALNLRTMPSPARGLWNISCLISDPGKTRQEKIANFKRAFFALKSAAAANGVPFCGELMATGGQTADERLLQEKADAAGVKISVAQIADAELLGGAAAAFFRLGIFSSIEEAAKKIARVGRTFFPRGNGGRDWNDSGGAGKNGSAELPRAAAFLADEKPSREKQFPQFFNMPKELSALLFDIDSTLYTNAAYAFEQVDCQVRRFALLRGISDDEARALVSDFRKKYAAENGGKKISLSNILLHFGISIERSVQWRRELIEPSDFLGEDKKLQAALQALSERFVLLCVTNNPILPAKKTLRALGAERFFPTLVGLDTCNLSKPAKEPFVLAARRAGVPPKKIASVGDRYDLDIAPALDLGMGGILVRGVEDVYRLEELL